MYVITIAVCVWIAAILSALFSKEHMKKETRNAKTN